MPFTIPNDPAAGVNPATYAAQAQPDKVDIDIIVASSNGSGVISGCAVTAQGSPNMTVAVASGTVTVADAVASVTGANVTITAADATNPRIDLVVANNVGALSATAGTAAASPCTPNIPANSVVLAEVYVPANITTIDSTRITDKRMGVPTAPTGWAETYLRPSAAVFETAPRFAVTNAAFPMSVGILYLSAIALPAGFTVGHIAFLTGSAGVTGPNHWWFGLYDSSFVQLAVTADQTSTPWTSNTLKSLAIATIASGASSTFTTTYRGLHYVGVMVAAGGGPNMVATTTGTVGGLMAPIISGQSDTAQTTPPAFPHTATAIGANFTNAPYGYVAA